MTTPITTRIDHSAPVQPRRPGVYSTVTEQLLQAMEGREVLFVFGGHHGATATAVLEDQLSPIQGLVCRVSPSGRYVSVLFSGRSEETWLEISSIRGLEVFPEPEMPAPETGHAQRPS